MNLSVSAGEENSGDVSGGDMEGVRGVLGQLFDACVEDLLTDEDSVFQTTGESAYSYIQFKHSWFTELAVTEFSLSPAHHSDCGQRREGGEG